VCWQRSQQVGCDGSASAPARRFVTAALGEILRSADPVDAAVDDEIVYDATLVTAELISNAVRACRRVVSITLTVHHRFIRIAVYDDGPGLPAIRSVSHADASGRGLRIIDSLSTRWGAERQNSGKSVWATLRLPTASAEHLDCGTQPGPA
jgi:anti-sigma regulatory factor (Ser/Thr protein kinase)